MRLTMLQGLNGNKVADESGSQFNINSMDGLSMQKIDSTTSKEACPVKK